MPMEYNKKPKALRPHKRDDDDDDDDDDEEDDYDDEAVQDWDEG